MLYISEDVCEWKMIAFNALAPQPTRWSGEHRELPYRGPWQTPAEYGFQCFSSVT